MPDDDQADDTRDDTGDDDGKKADDAPAFRAPKDQAEFDKMLSDRLRRERAKFADYDDLKAKAAQFDALDEASKSDLQKANDRAEAAEKTAADATVKAERTLRRAALLAAAGAAGAANAKTVALLLEDSDDVKVVDGDVTGAEEAVKKLIEDEPYLKGTAARPQGDADGGTRASGPDQLTREALKTMSPEEIVKAKAEGRLNDALGVKTS